LIHIFATEHILSLISLLHRRLDEAVPIPKQFHDDGT